MDVITTHVNADFDCLGSMVAAHLLYPQAKMVFAGAQERGLREFFVKSVGYALDFKRFRDIDLAAVTRLILVDVRQAERIGPFAELIGRKGVELHIYDHHSASENDLRGTLEIVEPVGATVTVLTRIIRQRGITPSPEEATMMMLGLYEDTGGLLFSSTTGADFSAAAFLLEQGADLNTVADFLTQELTVEQVALLHELTQNLSVLNVHGVDITLAHASTERFVGDLAMLTHKLKDMENCQVLIVAARMGDRIFLVGRSRLPEVDVREVLGEFGGGGHPYAASGVVRDLTLIQVMERLPLVLAQQVSPRWNARHLMSTPVKSVAVNTTISEARQLLTRYNLNALPVRDGQRVAGVITRQTLEKAAHHGLGKELVTEYMFDDVACATPETSVAELQELIVGNNQRFVPVIEGDRMVGAVTRTDLLRHLVSGGRIARLSSALHPDGGGGIKRHQLMRRLHAKIPERVVVLLKELGDLADELDCQLFAVGGFVRDLLLGEENIDLDLVVEGDAIVLAQAFTRRRTCRIRVHRKFGTAVIIFPDGYKIDVASARTEYYLEPGALPNVENSSLKLDLYRRDFSINTLALALNKEHFCELVDYFGGQRDLREKAVRVLHNLSFVEDPTRMFRAVRFEQRLGFRIGKHTLNLLVSAVRMGFLNKVGGSRLANELIHILNESEPFRALERLNDLGLLAGLHLELQLGRRNRRALKAVGKILHWYELLYAEHDCEIWLVYLLCLTCDLDDEAMQALCTRLTLPQRQRTQLVTGRAAGHQVLRYLSRRAGSDGTLLPSQLYRRLQPLTPEVILYLMSLTSRDAIKRWISHYLTHLRQVQCLLTGDDLHHMGMPSGPLYREVLERLLGARLDGRVVTHEDEVNWVRKRFRNHLPKG
ncbi:MAG: CBS domain-containing protein [Desulfuromonadales bacterium]|nr:CBS domain-containing protein [Desulfuromonadales bacterium]